MFDHVDIGGVAIRLQALRSPRFAAQIVMHHERSLARHLEEEPVVDSLAVALVADPSGDVIEQFFDALFVDLRCDADFEHTEIVVAVLVAMRCAAHPHLDRTLEYFVSQRAVAVARLRRFAVQLQGSR